MYTHFRVSLVLLSVLIFGSGAADGLENGLLGRYFNNTTATEPNVMTRTDPTVNFYWPDGVSPAVGVNANFSAQWTGYVKAPGTGTYTFYVYTDDGNRLWVNDVSLTNRWAAGAGPENSGSIALVEDELYPIKLEFFDSGGVGFAYLSWEGPNVPYKQIIPATYLFRDEVPTVVNVTSSLSNGGYRATQVISVEIEFSEDVTVTGTPALLLDMITTDRSASYVSTDGAVITLSYTLVAGDNAPDLDYVIVNSLTAGTIVSAVTGRYADRTLPFPGTAGSLSYNKNLVIDTVVPTVTAATGGVRSPMPDGTYRIGDEIDIQVYFSEPMWVTGSPTLLLETGVLDTPAVYDSGSGSNVLVFLYTVQAGDFSVDLTYQSTSALSPNTAVADIAGNNPVAAMLPAVTAAGSLFANNNLFINGVPIVVNVTSPVDDGRYRVGDVIPIHVEFSDPVVVTGTPTLTLRVNDTGPVNVATPYSAEESALIPDGKTMVFLYTVAANHNHVDVRYLNTTSLALAGGTIQDELGNNATLTLPAVGAPNSLDGNKQIVVESTAPTVSTNVRQNPTTTPTNAQEVTWRVTFADGGAAGALGGVTGVDANDFTITHTVVGISGAEVIDVTPVSDLIYDVTVDTGTGNGTLRLDVLTSAGATISDIAGNPYTANYTGGNIFAIDKASPTVTNVTSPTANGSYRAGQTINIQVVFSKAVTLNPVGAAYAWLLLETGAVDRTAPYLSGSGTTTLVFQYTIQPGDASPDLDYVATNSLYLLSGFEGATLRDALGNNADLTLPAPAGAGSLAANKALVIDTVIPYVTNVSSSSIDGTYFSGGQIIIQVTFSEPVNVTGAPTLLLETGAVKRAVAATNGTGLLNVNFVYNVANGENSPDLDYVAVDALGTVGVIQDPAGNLADRTLPEPGEPGSLGFNNDLIVTTDPVVIDVTSDVEDRRYGLGEVIPIKVVFSEPVNVPGAPTLTVNSNPNVAVPYTSGAGTDTLVFNYTVGAHNRDDLNYAATTSLAPNGSIQAVDNSNNAILTLPALAAASSLAGHKQIVVDGLPPTVTTNVRLTPSGQNTNAQEVTWRVTFLDNGPTGAVFPQGMLNVGVNDFTPTVTAGSITGATVLSVTQGATPLIWDVTVDTGTGDGNLRLDVLNTATMTDTAGTPYVANYQAGALYTIDKTPPTVTNVGSGLANGTYSVNTVVDIGLTFSENIILLPRTVGASLGLTLETGDVDRVAYYQAGGATVTTITVRYTVLAGDTSPDLDYVSINALELLEGSTLRDAVGNDAVLTLPVPGTPGSLGANKNIVISPMPTVVNVTSTVEDKRYGAGQVVPIQVVFSRAVNVTGTPTLTVNSNPNVAAPYVSGGGTDTLVFNYTVAAHNRDDLNYAAITSLALAGGTIRAVDTAANATLTLPALTAPNSLASNKDITVDGIAPTVSGIVRQDPTVQNTNSDTVVWRVTFVDNGPAGVHPLGVKNVDVADFTPTVTAGSMTGVTVTNVTEVTPLIYDVEVDTGTGNGTLRLDITATTPPVATITDNAGTSYAQNINTNANTFIVNKTPAVITNVTNGLADAVGNKYSAGQNIDITFTVDKAITLLPRTVGASVGLTLETGTVDQTAYYLSGGNNATTFVVRYTVQPGDEAADLEYLSVNALQLLEGSTIRDVWGNDANLTLPALYGTGSLGFNKNLVIDTEIPTVVNVFSTTANGTYGNGAIISLSVQFSEPVIVAGTPVLTMAAGNTNRNTATITGSGTDTISMIYTVLDGDYSLDLDYVATNSLSAGTSIRDGINAGSNNADRTLPEPGAPGSIGFNNDIVINTRPVISSVNSPLADGTYTVGTTVPIDVVFSEAVIVTGTPPFVNLTTSTTPAAVVAYGSGTGTDTLRFNYVIGAGQNVLDLNAASLVLSGGNLTDTNGFTPLNLNMPAAPNRLMDNKDITIDTTAPRVLNVNSSIANGTYTVDAEIPITVNFTGGIPVAGGGFPINSVFVDTTGGVPTLTLETGTVKRQATYVSGSGSTALLFVYKVLAGDSSPDLDYLSSVALNLNGGTIKDYVNDADLLLPGPGQANSLGANKNIVISAVLAEVTNVTSTTANGSYRAGQTITLWVDFSKPVTVTGTPLLILETSAVDSAAEYITGSGSSTLRFRYVVQPGDTSPDLDYVDVNALVLNGGTIKDSLGNNAVRDLPAPGGEGSLSFNKDLVIDTTPPEITSITRLNPPDAITSATSVTFAVTFSEPVTGVATTDFELAMTDITDAFFTAVTGDGTDYTVTVNTGSGSGTVGLNANATDGPSIDAAGNQRSGTLTGEVYTIDKTGPTVTAIDRSVPPGDITGLASVTFAVTFDEDAFNVAEADFTLVDTGVSGAEVTGVSGSGQNWNVTVSTGTGNGSIRLDANAFVDGPAEDAYGNLRSGAFEGQTYTIDKTQPHITAINRSVPLGALTNAASVTYAVTFDEDVLNVAAADFDLVTTGGITGASIGTIAGSDANYTVEVDTGTGDGTIRLNANDAADGPAEDLIGNLRTGSFTGQMYTVDKTPPTLLSITRVGANPTNAASVTFVATFSESVGGVAAADFAIAASGVSGAAITNVDGSGAAYAIEVSTGTGSGTLGLNAAPTDGPAADPTGNLRTGALTGEVFTIDRTGPQVTAITRSVPAGPRTNATEVEFLVQFDEPVTGVVAGDFSVVAVGVAGVAIQSISGTGDQRTVTVATPTGEGTVRLDALAGPGPATDLLGNQRTGALTGETYTFDRTAPQVTATNRAVPAQQTTNAASVTFLVTFNENVTGFAAGDFDLALTGTVSGAAITAVNGSGTNWTVDVSTGAGDGTLGLNSVTGGPGTDVAGNPLEEGFTGQTYTLDKTPPLVSVNTLRTNDPTPALSGSVNDNDATISVTVDAQTLPAVNNDDGTWTLPDNTLAALLDGVYDVVAVATDPPGNPGTDTSTNELTIDTTPPSITNIQSTVPQAERGDVVQLAATVTDVSLLGTPTLTVNGNPATFDTTVGGVYTYSYTILPSDPLGPTTIVVSATDGLNPAQATNTTALEVIDITPPTLLSITPIGPNPTSETNVEFQFVFSENVQDFDATDVQSAVTGTGLGAIVLNAPVQIDGATYTLNVTGIHEEAEGTITLSLRATQNIRDLASNALVLTGVSGMVTLSNELSVSAVAGGGYFYTGDNVALSVVRTGGTGPYTFTWKKNGNPIPGAPNAAAYAFTAAVNVEDLYTCTVVDQFDNATVTAAAASVQVREPLAVDVPATVGAYLGGPATLDATVTGGFTPVAYQWYKDADNDGQPDAGEEVLNGGAFSGATTATLVIDPVDGEEGDYFVVVTDANPTLPPKSSLQAVVVSDIIAVISGPALTILGPTPNFVQLYSDRPAFQMSITATGGIEPLAFEWFHALPELPPLSLAALPGGTTTEVTINPADIPRGDAVIYCVVSDAAGDHPSDNALVEIEDHLSFVQELRDAVAELGKDFTFELEIGGGLGDIVFEWSKDDGTKAFVPIATTSEPSLTLPTVTAEDAGLYQVQVFDEEEMISSQAMLTVSAGVPAAGLAALSLLVGACAAGGAMALRRRNPRRGGK